jgi:alpha-D-ribose 1-methylphosphonate 5-triphosphate synthase subunit PhnG
MNHSRCVAMAGLDYLKAIAEDVLSGSAVKVIREPAPGMVMVRHVDPLDRTPFFLGEAYVTECEVEVDGRIGYSCVLGAEEERSLYGAIIDAVVGNGLPAKERVVASLEAAWAEVDRRREAESRRFGATKVAFDLKQ